MASHTCSAALEGLLVGELLPGVPAARFFAIRSRGGQLQTRSASVNVAFPNSTRHLAVNAEIQPVSLGQSVA